MEYFLANPTVESFGLFKNFTQKSVKIDQMLTNVSPKMEPICKVSLKMELMCRTIYKVEYGIVTCTEIYVPHCLPVVPYNIS